MKGLYLMEERKFKKRIIYFLLPLLLFFLVENKVNPNILYLFPVLFIFIKKMITSFSLNLSALSLFSILLFLYQTRYPVNLSESLDTIQFILLSQNKMALLSVSLVFLLAMYYFFQEKIQATLVHSNDLILHPVKILKTKKDDYINLYSEGKTKLNRRNIRSLIKDIPRHGYLNYTNQSSLSKDFLKLSEQSIQKENYLYLVLSETGSPASEILSLFTHKNYNHLSLSFDRSLYTMVSYNGGNSYQNPGLNRESLANLNQKKDSQLLVYRMQVAEKDRLIILNKIKEINKKGSAYNVVGLLTNIDVRPNMMYCSQFVYQMLKEVDLNFFEPIEDKIKPTDFIDYDSEKRLTFEYKIDFSKMDQEIR